MKKLKYTLSKLGLIVLFLLGGCQKYHERVDQKIIAHDFLSSEAYDELVIEINYVNGFEPTEASIGSLVDFLKERLHKPGGISIIKKNITTPDAASFDLSIISDIEKNNRRNYSKRHQLSCYVLFLDKEYAGGSSGGGKVLGVQYGTTSVALFGKTISDHSDGSFLPSRSVLESTVLRHEFGHLMGLVNNGSPETSSHSDLDHQPHCSNKNCLMYYKAETGDIVSSLWGGKIPELDEDCINDLKANGGL